MSYQQEKFTAIADNIRSCLRTNEKIKPSDFATKVFDVFDAGRSSLMPSLNDANQTISEQRKTIEEQSSTIEKQESEILRQQNTIKSQALNIDRLTDNVIAYEIQLVNTAQAILDVGVEDATIDNTAEKVSEVFETGKKAQYDEFWDNYQDNGLREHYSYAFAQWNKNTFQPKYDIKPTAASYMFYSFNQNISVESLPELLKNNNITIDFSKCGVFAYFGSYSYISDFGFIDCSSANNLNHMFNQASRLNTVSLKLKNDGSQSFTSTFDACTRLADITIEGVIGQNISFSACASLLQDSIISIISALSDTSIAKTVTFSQTAVNVAFETSEGAKDGSTSDDWTTLIATKTNWTISLI